MQRRTIIACLASSFVGLASAPGCSSKSSGTFGSEPEDGGSSGSSSSSSSATGSSSSSSSTSSGSGSSSSGSASGSGGHPSSTSSSGSSTGGSMLNDAGVPLCYETPCNLQSNTCCVAQILSNSSCIPHGQSCPQMTAAFSCLQETDCTSGQYCCGIANSQAGTATASCQTVTSAGDCPGMITSTQAYAQLCTQTSECQNGMECVKQTCQLNTVTSATLTMCGLQAKAPFNCTMD